MYWDGSAWFILQMYWPLLTYRPRLAVASASRRSAVRWCSLLVSSRYVGRGVGMSVPGVLEVDQHGHEGDGGTTEADEDCYVAAGFGGAADDDCGGGEGGEDGGEVAQSMAGTRDGRRWGRDGRRRRRHGRGGVGLLSCG